MTIDTARQGDTGSAEGKDPIEPATTYFPSGVT